ncbi:response regulator SirA [Fulvimarina endophytica]|uniref:Response regulator SirA n=1 Tax=Fulvimarina endophytica TaxID=2293836 RepID=A0A371X0F6_9HYPH|nr:sulfurtransferase TusA family protein [Fulvimarina endophytica]RFC62675.1 response regulator SirA [Fulvimarina endophytica]
MRELDLRGLRCPLPTLKARKALNAMAPGERLRVIADDPMAAIDLPHFLNASHHALQDSGKEDERLWFVAVSGGAPRDRMGESDKD